MLQNDFYNILSLEKAENKIQTQLALNPEHRIFEGHFPGQPVVPGVCMVQIIKEVLEQVLEKSLQLQTADHIKFLSVIVPRMSPLLQLSISYSFSGENIEAVATLQKDETTSLKFKGCFVVV